MPPEVSALQAEMWRSLPALDDPAALHYGTCSEIRGPLDLVALEAAASWAVARHDGLRMGFAAAEGVAGVRAWYALAEEIRVEVGFQDTSDRPEAERRPAALGWLRAERARPFVLSRPPLVRLATARLAEEHHLVLVAFHHLVLDGPGVRILLQDMAAAYGRHRGGEGLELDAAAPASYKEYARQDRVARARPEARAAAEACARALEAAEPLDLPILRLEAGAPAGTCSLELDPELIERLRDRVLGLGAFPFLGYGAAFLELLARHFERDAVCVGTPTNLRTGRSQAGLVGHLANALVLRATPAGCRSFSDLLAAVRQAALEANRFRTVTGLELAPALGRQGPPHHDLIQVFYDFDPLPGPWLELPGTRAARLEFPPEAAHFALRWCVRPGEARPEVRVDFDRRRLDRARVEAMLAEYRVILEAATRDPEKPLRDIPRLDESGHRRLVVEANRTAVAYPEAASVPALVAEAVTAHQDRVALTWRDQSWSYRKLGARARGLARRLQDQGVVAGSRVGVVARRRPETVVAFLAALELGAAYVPLDPEYPAGRLQFMAQDAALGVVLDPVPEDGFPALDGVRVVPGAELEETCEGAPPPGPAPEDLCYVMYTSGSTGRPKGVPITHRAVVRLVRNNAHLEIGPGDGFAQAGSLSFDVSALEVWGALANGARLVLLEDADLQAPTALRSLLAARGVTHLWLTTPLFELLAGQAPDAFGDLRTLYVGGARVGVEAVEAVLKAAAPGRLINSYGPTETCFSSFHVVTPEDLGGTSIPIGRPISNTTLYVVDRHGRPVPEGVPGELWIGGPGVSPGYLGRPELTAARFSEDPFRPGSGERVYRSGDRVARRPDGAVVFLGRFDDQVKLRGHRVELGEVEAALAALPGVVAAACRVTGEGSRQALAGYVVLGEDAGPAPDPETMRRALAEALPGFMVPSTLQVLAQLPLTRHGKVDRDRLPRIDRGGRRKRGPPVTAPCERLLEVFREILASPRLTPDEDLFEVGATSLQALEICSQIETWLGVRVPLTLLREHPTARSLHDHLPGSTPVEGAGSLVRLVDGGREGALVLMPDSDLREAMVCDLARALGPGPQVLSFRHRGYRDGSQPPGTLPELAAEFADDLARAGIRGPFGLFGHCLGGYFAWELAHQLEQREERVAFVFMNDSWLPPAAMSPAARLWIEAHGFLRAGTMAWEGLRRGGWKKARKQLRYGLAAQRVGMLRAWLETWTGQRAYGGRESRGGAVALAMADATERWRPGEIRAPVACGLSELWGPRLLGMDPRRGWSSLTRGGASWVQMPGRHTESLMEPWVATSASRLEEVMVRFRLSGS